MAWKEWLLQDLVFHEILGYDVTCLNIFKGLSIKWPVDRLLRTSPGCKSRFLYDKVYTCFLKLYNQNDFWGHSSLKHLIVILYFVWWVWFTETMILHRGQEEPAPGWTFWCFFQVCLWEMEEVLKMICHWELKVCLRRTVFSYS